MNLFRGLKFAIPASVLMWAALAVLVWVMAGCALVPDYVAPELEHISHATQHEPFVPKSEATRYGANIASVVVGYKLPHNLNVELAEGVSLDRHYTGSGQWGEIEGPREQFTARIRYMIQVKK
jgi:hypothetical protein